MQLGLNTTTLKNWKDLQMASKRTLVQRLELAEQTVNSICPSPGNALVFPQTRHHPSIHGLKKNLRFK
jgi:hypothetical protein